MADEVEGYLHSISPVKISKNQNRYFNAMLQTDDNSYKDLVCFAADRRNELRSLQETKSPVKICNVTLTPGKRRSTSQDIQIDKRSKICSTALHFQHATPDFTLHTTLKEIKEEVNVHHQVCSLEL